MTKDEINVTKPSLVDAVNAALDAVTAEGSHGPLVICLPKAYRSLGLTPDDVQQFPLRYSHLKREHHFRILEKTTGGMRVRH